MAAAAAAQRRLIMAVTVACPAGENVLFPGGCHPMVDTRQRGSSRRRVREDIDRRPSRPASCVTEHFCWPVERGSVSSQAVGATMELTAGDGLVMPFRQDCIWGGVCAYASETTG